MKSSNPNSQLSFAPNFITKHNRPVASMSMDLDNKWSYMKTHGDKRWTELPSYLDILIPHVLDILDGFNLKITFFIVGKDAARQENHDALRLIPQRGHEVGNHSYHHEPWLHQYSKPQIQAEILDTQEEIFKITGKVPVGFRGPGFSWSKDLLETLAENNYLYDASSLPTFLGPVARLYYFWTSDLSLKEKEKRKGLFGGFRDGFRPVKPFKWKLENGKSLLEIPVTTIPVFKTPFHLSYLLYLSRFSPALMYSYLNCALLMCRLTKTAPSFLLHPLDLLGPDQISGLSFFPGMDIDSRVKAKYLKKVLAVILRSFRIVNMQNHAKKILKQDVQFLSASSN